MNKAAARLRAQKAYSTDPEYLERMAVDEETREPQTLSVSPAGRRPTPFVHRPREKKSALAPTQSGGFPRR